jgi:hypothetical protein
MTLPASGTITLTMIAAEYGESLPRTLTHYYGKPGLPASGAIKFSDFYGKEAITFTPVPGTYDDSNSGTSTLTVSSNIAVPWTYTKASSTTASSTSGTTTTSITFTVTSTGSGGHLSRSDTVILSTTYNGVTYNWTLNLTAAGL